MSLTFTRAELATPGEVPTSRVQRSLARAINDRLRGPTDSAWRVAWATYNQARLVRNPDASGHLFPSEFEFFALYAHLPRGEYQWPLTGPGDPEGANLGSVLPQFVFGNPALSDEPARLAELFPMRINGRPPETPEEIWTLGKMQRGVQTPEGYQYAPAFEAAQTVFQFAFHPRIWHGKTYGGWQPTAPQDPGVPWCGNFGTDYYYWENLTPYWTALAAGVDTSGLHGTVTIVDGLPRVTYAGSCPCGSDYTAAGHVLWVGKYPFAWYVGVSRGTVDADGNCEYDVDRLPTADWIEGPYDGAPSLAHGDAGHILRASHAYHSDFRGADSERTPDTFRIESIAFDNQDFFTRQYPLAPSYGIGDKNGLAAIYPGATLTADGTVQLNGEAGPWVHHPGYVIAGLHAHGDGLVRPVTVTLLDGSKTLASLTLTPDTSGHAAASRWGISAQPASLSVRVAGMPNTGGTVTVEAAELVDYRPQAWDAYLVSRMTTARGE